MGKGAPTPSPIDSFKERTRIEDLPGPRARRGLDGAKHSTLSLLGPCALAVEGISPGVRIRVDAVGARRPRSRGADRSEFSAAKERLGADCNPARRRL
jgi:hypothetical protein